MSRGTPALAEQSPQAGAVLGNYRLIGRAGEGNLGPLYAAEQRKIRDVANTVALRCIRPEIARLPEFHSRFTALASAVRRLEHPNILSIHEMDVADGSYFLSMEYVPGEKVTSILTRCNTGSPVPPDIAALIVKQAANAAQYVRTIAAAAGKALLPGQAELDLANLFVTYHGTVKWLAIDLQPRAEVGPASSGEHVLSRSRAAESGAADGNADVSSLGALLWTFLTGHRPQLTPVAIEPAAALGGGVPPSSIQPAVPEALDAIVLRALSPQHGQRFASPGELSEALDRYLLQRGARPTHKHTRRWMELLFEPERAALQLQIARGRDVAAALAALANLHAVDSPALPHSSRRARELWSTRHSIFARPSRTSLEPVPRSLQHDPLPVSERDLREAPPTYRAMTPPVAPTSSLALPRPPTRPRLWLLGGLLAVSSLVGASALLLPSAGVRPPLPSATPAARSQLDVRSTPEGAAVFVDGEPTGLRTPALLKGLAGGRTLRLRVEKAGFKSQERELALMAGEATTQAFDLVAADGTVHFAGVPPGARLFVDDSLVPAGGKPVSLSVGQHLVRVETPSALLFAGTVAVVAGEQTIRVDAGVPSP